MVLLLVLGAIKREIITWFLTNVLPTIVIFAVVLAIMLRRTQHESLGRAIQMLVDDETQDKGLLGRHEVVLDDAAIRDVTAATESRTRWSAVDRVEQDEAYIFIYTSAHAACVIPKRAFADTAAAIAFHDAAMRYRDAAAGR